jgi:hypothetical protein
MKRPFFLVIIICIGLSGHVSAALGDSEDYIANLFGKPTNQGFPDARGITTNVYGKGNYVILVQFLQHLSLAESYTRVDQHDFSQDEIAALLEGNSSGRGWGKNPDKMEWERSDHKVHAWLQTISGRPTFLFQAE